MLLSLKKKFYQTNSEGQKSTDSPVKIFVNKYNKCIFVIQAFFNFSLFNLTCVTDVYQLVHINFTFIYNKVNSYVQSNEKKSITSIYFNRNLRQQL